MTIDWKYVPNTSEEVWQTTDKLVQDKDYRGALSYVQRVTPAYQQLITDDVIIKFGQNPNNYHYDWQENQFDVTALSDTSHTSFDFQMDYRAYIANLRLMMFLYSQLGEYRVFKTILNTWLAFAQLDREDPAVDFDIHWMMLENILQLDLIPQKEVQTEVIDLVEAFIQFDDKFFYDNAGSLETVAQIVLFYEDTYGHTESFDLHLKINRFVSRFPELVDTNFYIYVLNESWYDVTHYLDDLQELIEPPRKARDSRDYIEEELVNLMLLRKEGSRKREDFYEGRLFWLEEHVNKHFPNTDLVARVEIELARYYLAKYYSSSVVAYIAESYKDTDASEFIQNEFNYYLSNLQVDAIINRIHLITSDGDDIELREDPIWGIVGISQEEKELYRSALALNRKLLYYHFDHFKNSLDRFLKMEEALFLLEDKPTNGAYPSLVKQVENLTLANTDISEEILNSSGRLNETTRMDETRFLYNVSMSDETLLRVMIEWASSLFIEDLLLTYSPESTQILWVELEQEKKGIYGLVEKSLIDDDKKTLIDFGWLYYQEFILSITEAYQIKQRLFDKLPFVLTMVYDDLYEAVQVNYKVDAPRSIELDRKVLFRKVLNSKINTILDHRGFDKLFLTTLLKHLNKERSLARTRSEL